LLRFKLNKIFLPSHILLNRIHAVQECAREDDSSITDGNKRIGAFLFVWFLEKNKHRFKKSGEVKINDNALVALALLVAQSNPDDKEIMIKLVMNLIRS
jgi:hypothetical protein